MKPGLLVTQYSGSDRYAFVVVKVINPKTLRLVPGKSIPQDTRFTACCEFHCDECRNGKAPFVATMDDGTKIHCTDITLRSDGVWRARGRTKVAEHYYSLGKAIDYRDPEF